MKIVIITGTRPQLIKTALLDKRLRQEHDVSIVHTGQHYDPEMSGNFFKELDIPEPDAVLGVGGLSSLMQLSKMLDMLEVALETAEPDLVIVVGDTNTALGGALAASKLHIPIAHVEAGCRCGDRSVPEEINRILVDHMSDLLFCPTIGSFNSLRAEGIWDGPPYPQKPILTGDVLYDTYLHYNGLVGAEYLPPSRYTFATIHREANTDNRESLAQIVKALSNIEGEVIFPVHPRTSKASEGQKDLGDNISGTKPMGYLEALSHIRGAKLVITDSGGVQREAYFAKVPSIYIGTAGWPELFQCGASEYVPADTEKILETVRTFTKPQFPEGIFGDGTAVEKIATAIREWVS